MRKFSGFGISWKMSMSTFIPFLLLSLGYPLFFAAADGLPTETPSTRASSSQLDRLLDATMLPGCLHQCAFSLVSDIYSALKDQRSHSRFIKICSDYEIARSCILQDARQCQEQIPLFNLLTSGLEFGCREEREAFERFMPCVERYANVDQTGCERSCDLYEKVSNLANSDSLKQVVKRGGSALITLSLSGDLCSGIFCYLKCTRERVEEHCPSSGQKLIETFIRPIDNARQSYEHLSGDMLNLINRYLPRECEKFLQQKYLDEIRYDEAFLNDLHEAIEEAKQKRLKDSSSSSEQLVLDTGERNEDAGLKGNRHVVSKNRDFDSSLMEIASEDETNNPSIHNGHHHLNMDLWRLDNIVILLFVSSILLGTFVALIISCVWCIWTVRSIVPVGMTMPSGKSPVKMP